MNIQRSVNRRELLRLAAAAAGVSIAAPWLVACGGSESTPTSTATTGGGEPAASGAATPTSAASSTPSSDTTPSPAATQAIGGSLTVYSGRNEQLVQATVDDFSAATGIDAQMRYGSTAELAAAILEEGKNSPADVFFAQDAGALGALAQEGLLAPLPEDILSLVEPRFRSSDGLWVGVSGRARAIVYNTDKLSEADLPESILDFTDPAWKGRVGWAPPNASFQSQVTAMRVLMGDEATLEWLQGMQANDVKYFESNGPIVRAVIDGELDAGLVNHYYLHRELAEAGGDLPAKNFIYRNGDPGALINVAGVGLLTTAKNQEQALAFIRHLLSPEAQEYFAEETFEYPLVEGVPTDPALVPLSDIQTPEIDLSDLADLSGTLELLRDAGLL